MLISTTTESNIPLWPRYIKTRIQHNKDFVCAFVGATGSGKTYASLTAALMCDDKFNTAKIIFEPVELLKVIHEDDLPRGTAIVLEEVGISMNAAKWQSAINLALNFVFQTVRHRGYIIFMTLPNLAFLQKANRLLLHGVFETRGINWETNCCKLVGKLLQYETYEGQIYKKFLRVHSEEGIVPVKEWFVPKPPDWLIEEYEKKKKEFTDELYHKTRNQLQLLYNSNSNDAKNKQYSTRGVYQVQCPKKECGAIFATNKNNPRITCPKCTRRLQGDEQWLPV